MGFVNFQICKDIILPIAEGDELSLHEYKEKYGIDLAEIIELLDNGHIQIKPLPVRLWLYLVGSLWGETSTPVIPVVSSYFDNYVSGSHNAQLDLGVYNHDDSTTYGIRFLIPSEGDYNFDNLIISAFEG